MTTPTDAHPAGPLMVELDLVCPADHAFAVWTTRIDSWWPPDHTVSGDPEQVVLQGRHRPHRLGGPRGRRRGRAAP